MSVDGNVVPHLWQVRHGHAIMGRSMSAIIILLVLLLAAAGQPGAGADADPTLQPIKTDHDPPWGHRTGDGAIVDFIGGTIEIAFKPVAGSTRAVLRFRCAPGRCARNFRDPVLQIPIANAPHLRVKFRSVKGELVSTTALSRLPHGTMLSFSLSGRRHTLQMR